MQYLRILATIMIFTSAVSAADLKVKPAVYSMEVECGVFIVVLAPNFNSEMTVGELLIEAENSVSYQFMENEGCIYPSGSNRGRKKSVDDYSSSRYQAYEEDGNLQSDPPPAPPGDDWVLINSFQNRQTINSLCLVIVTDVWVYRRPDGEGGYTYLSLSESYEINILGCEADSIGNE